jgi:hypothetical protein
MSVYTPSFFLSFLFFLYEPNSRKVRSDEKCAHPNSSADISQKKNLHKLFYRTRLKTEYSVTTAFVHILNKPFLVVLTAADPAPQFLDDSSFSVCDFALQYKYSSVNATQYQYVLGQNFLQ